VKKKKSKTTVNLYVVFLSLVLDYLQTYGIIHNLILIVFQPSKEQRRYRDYEQENI